MSLLHFFVFSIALWRFSHMAVYERGFLDVFVWFRERIGITHDDEKNPIGANDSNFARLFSCLWCASMFLAIPYAFLVYLWQDVLFWVSLPFATSALAIAWNGIAEK